MKHVSIFTDGACSGNPGIGGCSAVLFCGDNIKKVSCGYRWTTSMRMETIAILLSLSQLKYPCNVRVTTDNSIVQIGLKNLSNNKKVYRKNKYKNKDLWDKIAEEVRKHKVEAVLIKGHSGNKYNDLADDLAVSARLQSEDNLLIDYEYEVVNPYKGYRVNEETINELDLRFDSLVNNTD